MPPSAQLPLNMDAPQGEAGAGGNAHTPGLRFLGWNAPLPTLLGQYFNHSITQKEGAEAADDVEERGRAQHLLMVPTTFAKHAAQTALNKHLTKHSKNVSVHAASDYLPGYGGSAPNMETLPLWPSTDAFELHTYLQLNGLNIAQAAQLLGEANTDADAWKTLAAAEAEVVQQIQQPRQTSPAKQGEGPCHVFEHLLMPKGERAGAKNNAPKAFPPPIHLYFAGFVHMPGALKIAAQQALAAGAQVSVLVHAPETDAPAFDAWGCPQTDVWEAFPLSLKPKHITVCADAPGAARHLLSLSKTDGPLAVITPEEAVQLHIARGAPNVWNAGWSAQKAAYEEDAPEEAEGPFQNNLKPALHALQALQALFTESVPALQPLCTLAALLKPQGAFHITQQLQAAQAYTLASKLPVFLDYFAGRMEHAHNNEGAHAQAAHNFLTEVHTTLHTLNTFEHDAGSADAGGAASVAQTVCSFLQLPASLQAIFTTPHWLAQKNVKHVLACMVHAVYTKLQLVQNLAQQLSAPAQWAPWAHGNALFTEAPAVALLGFSEEALAKCPAIPTLVAPLLPQSAKVALGLPGHSTQHAASAYILEALLQSCGVHALPYTYLPDGSALKPSRLLMQVAPSKFMQQVHAVYGKNNKDENKEAINFQNNDKQPWALNLPNPAQHMPTRISTTGFKDYLQCPFRFYLKHVLKLQPPRPVGIHISAADFGTLMHAALEAFGLKQMEALETGESLTDGAFSLANTQQFLQGSVRGRVQVRWGKALSPALQLQLESALARMQYIAQNLHAAAQEGWVPTAIEYAFGPANPVVHLEGFVVSGSIDRLEKNVHTGALRVVDFKTSDTATRPEAAHYKPKGNQWVNLQLPIYMQAAHTLHPGAVVHPAYFHIPKALTRTGYDVWEAYNTSVHTQAMQAAAKVASAVRRGVFWPPASIPPNMDTYAAFMAANPVVQADVLKGCPEPETLNHCVNHSEGSAPPC